MSETFNLLMYGFEVAFTIQNLIACFFGVFAGTVVGVLPGIGTNGAMALLLPLSFALDATTGIIMVAGVYYGASYGGSTTSILFNIPGEASSAVTCIEGYQMAKKGRAGAALTVSAIGSFIAGTLGLVGLMYFAPPLARFALAFGPPEFFAVGTCGLLILCNLTGKPLTEALLMLFLGLLLSTVGIDIASSVNRLTFGVDELQRGFEITTVFMGAFGISEMLDAIVGGSTVTVAPPSVKLRDLYPTLAEWKRSIWPIARGSVLGFFMGLIPGSATTISSFLSYRIEKGLSKRPEEWGHGAIEGVAGPESANNSAASGAMIPILSLGLAFSSAPALLLCVLIVHGVTPGPFLITQNPALVWGFIASMYIGNVMLVILNLPLISVFVAILKIPSKYLMPLITAITLTGAFALNNSIFDIWMVAFFGLLGYLMKKPDLDPIPLVIGMLIGEVVEQALRQGLLITDGSFIAFFFRPISGIILSLAVVVVMTAIVGPVVRRLRHGKPHDQG